MSTRPKPDSIKLSDCATTLEEARGVIDRQEALIAELRKALDAQMHHQRELRADRDRLDWLDDQNEGGFHFSRDASGFFHATVCVHLAGKKIRAAIDSEMKLTKEENEN